MLDILTNINISRNPHLSKTNIQIKQLTGILVCGISSNLVIFINWPNLEWEKAKEISKCFFFKKRTDYYLV